MVATSVERITVQAGPLTCFVRKAGTGQPLLYMHGAFDYKDWPGFLERLTQRFAVYVPQHPGFTDENRDALDSIDDCLDLTLYYLDVLESLALESPALVGHGFGAMIAAEMAAVSPRSVSRLVLAAPLGLWLDGSPGADIFATPAGELRSVLFADAASEVAKAVLPEPQSDEERAAQGVERVRALSSVAKFTWPIPDKGLKKRLHRVKAPTLVLVGEQDRVVPPAYGHEFSRRIRGAKLHAIKGAGHMFHLEKPDEFADLVAGFLN